jgi:hypothetical protein
MTDIRPVLTQYASAASSAAGLPPEAFVSAADSMLYVPGSSYPLIECILSRAESGRGVLETVLTEAGTDPDDPDLLRVGQHHLSTLITRSEDEAIDPDLLRFGAETALSTMMTKSEEDPGDPDTVRAYD